MKKVLHIITGLNNGGAEGVLYRLCKYDNSSRHIVISLMGGGKYGALLKEVDVEVHCLNMPAGRVSLAGVVKLFKLLRKLKPDVVQTWMYHADLLGGIVARCAGIRNVFWNIRNTTLEAGKSKKTTIFVARLCARLSGFIPKGIVCCAQEAMLVHSALGYKKSKIKLIANGYDFFYFKPDNELRDEFRGQLVLPPLQAFLGMVGRFDSQKDHFGLLKALWLVKAYVPNFKFAMVGRGLNKANAALGEQINKLNLNNNILLLDQRADISTVMNGLDIHVLSSAFGEAFPNVLAESMACGTPCVTTNVGDAAVIVGETGWVVPPKDPQALADAIIMAIKEMQMDDQAWSLRQQACRDRVVKSFSIEKMISGYHRVWFG